MLKPIFRKTQRRIKKEIEQYLKEINFDKRLERGKYFTNREFRKLLVQNLEDYLKGKKTQDFIIELGAVFYPEIMTSLDKQDDPLMTSVCILSDMALNNKSSKSKKKRNLILENILKLLTGKLTLKKFLKITENIKK